MKKYVIVPDCLDLNRGDQSLIWEAIRIFKDAGMDGEFFVLGESHDCQQSIKHGYKCYNHLLPHPSRNKKTNNVHYGIGLMMKWGIIALFDFLRSLYVLLIANTPSLFFTLPRNIRETVKLYRESDALIVKGGGFLQTFGKITDGYFTYYHIYSLLFANRINLPIYVMPNSFGPLDGFSVKWQVRKALKKCKVIYCRESISYDYMKNTFPDIDFKLTYDLGFYLQPQEPKETYKLTEKKNVVAITVRPYRFPEHSSDVNKLYENYLKSITEFCSYLINKGFYPNLIQHTLAVNSHEDDMTAIQKIQSNLPTGKYGIFADTSYNCSKMKSIYSHCDYIVGTRFHSVIFSLASHVPALSIAYGGNKSRGIMKDIGFEEYVIDIDKITTSELISKFDVIVKNKENIQRQLADVMPSIEIERKSIVAYIEELKNK